jgi:hypothetical protein
MLLCEGAFRSSYAHYAGSGNCVVPESVPVLTYGVVTETLSKVAVAWAVVFPLFTAKPTYTF